MQATTAKPKFQPGVLLATPGASEAFEKNRQTPFEFLQRHVAGDWGEELCQEDRLLNDQALIDGSRLLSAYRLKDGTRIWCISEAVSENGKREVDDLLAPRGILIGPEPCYAVTNQTRRMLYRNCYECSECGTKWTDEWDSMCNDRCPKCSHGNRAIRFGRTLIQGARTGNVDVAKIDNREIPAESNPFGSPTPGPLATNGCPFLLFRLALNADTAVAKIVILQSGFALRRAENFCKSGLAKNRRRQNWWPWNKFSCTAVRHDPAGP